MKKRKEPTHEKASPSTFLKVRQRTKGHSITIEGFVKPMREAFIRGEHVFRRAGNDTIKLKVTVSPSDWAKLWSYCLNYRNEFVEQFWSNLIYPAMMELETKKGARGRNKEKQQLVHWIKTEASFLYAFFSYWCKKPLKEWPGYLKRLEVMAKKDDYGDYIKRKSRYDAQGLTDYCLRKLYEKNAQRAELKLFDNPENFLLTYVHAERRATRNLKLFIKGKSPQEISNLAYQPPLKRIFECLKIL